MKRFRNIALALVVISFFLVVAVCTFYNINMAKVSNDDTLMCAYDTICRIFEIPLILCTDTMIMLEIKEQQENFI